MATGAAGSPVTRSVLVFTRDLRVHDNPALAAAARGEVIPLFVLDDAIVRGCRQNPARLAFLLGSLRDLDASLRERGGRLIVRRGPWAATVARIAAGAGAGRVHVMRDVSGYAARRHAELAGLCRSARIDLACHPGVMIAGPGELSPAGGGPYRVFTPYYRRWLAHPRRPAAPAPARLAVPGELEPGRLPRLGELTTSRNAAAPPAPGETAGLARLGAWAAGNLAGYERARDDLAADATSRLSPYLHLGCLSPLAVAGCLAARPGAEPFVRQLAWRDFFCQLLAARPDAAHRDFVDRGDRWHDDPDGLAAWAEGRTGYPVVDAAMRQLAAEGFMHNRARMIVASFLTKDLRVDWRAGARHFMARLADADVACNQLNWQWVAGTGTDSQRHRMFSPARQGRRFDPRGEYIRRYLPELDGLGADEIHDPPPAVRRSRRYPAPIVDHQAAAAAWRSLSRAGRLSYGHASFLVRDLVAVLGRLTSAARTTRAVRRTALFFRLNGLATGLSCLPVKESPVSHISSAIAEPLLAAQRRSAELETLIEADPGRFRILTGDRPTGPLHLGHYFGTLAARVRLQRAGVRLLVLIADYQVLTDRDVTQDAASGLLAERVDGLVADYLAVGIDPSAATIFAHSAVPALHQLMLPFLSLVSVPELQRNPTVKEEIALSGRRAVSGLMLTYPVHQAADILFCKANLVPVGKDQLPHLEITRSIARRFNERYAGGAAFFPVPDPLLSPAPSLLGTDGAKMSKSRGNAIALAATADETARLIRSARTDARRDVSYEPHARPEVSSLVLLAALCQGRDPADVAAEIGGRGAAGLKRVVTESVNELLRPVRARRAQLAADRGYLRRVLRDGNARASAIASATLTDVHALMGTG